ncbi:hypothetical protein ACFFYR_21610 [Paraburkholderia dipogonis]|uniref:hypothetical protein n=1 Tax=Paraburkholderia dipogonis TaxID=1211383 RepID=UPI0035E6A09B
MIDGLDLLRIVQKYCNRKVLLSGHITCQGAGTAANPWRPLNIQHWFELACHVKANKAIQYFAVAGRLIMRDIVHDLYFSDVGPVWRQGVPAPEVAFNASVAPTYRVGAQIMRAPQEVFPQNAAWAREAKQGGVAAPLPLPLSWNDATRQPAVIQAIRALLSGAAPAMSTDYSRLQHSLPVFVCAMFIAEPARNIRAFLINLILLDLAERGHFTVGEMFWHPQAIDVDSALAGSVGWNGANTVVGHVDGPGAPRTTLAPVATLGELHHVGGIMPASPTGGGAHAKAEALVGKNNGARPAVVVDFIHRKEISVVVHWLALRFPALWSAVLPGAALGAAVAAFPAVVHSDPVGNVAVSKKFFDGDAAAASALQLTTEIRALDAAISARLGNATRQL